MKIKKLHTKYCSCSNSLGRHFYGGAFLHPRIKRFTMIIFCSLQTNRKLLGQVVNKQQVNTFKHCHTLKRWCEFIQNKALKKENKNKANKENNNSNCFMKIRLYNSYKNARFLVLSRAN